MTKTFTTAARTRWQASHAYLRFAAFVILALGAVATASAQITPSQDAYTNTADPTQNYGIRSSLGVQTGSQTTFIQFDLSSIPAGYGSANVAKATLKLYVNSVNTPGSFNVDYINGAWSEQTITANLSPALGTTIAGSVPLTAAQVHDYIIIDVTSAVGAWLDKTQPNDGLALVANSPLNASFDSKENTSNSQPAELDVVLTGNGAGTITGVTTAAGSGLSGGGNSGTLNLALTKSCAANQVLQWNGSSWVCSSAGSGTVTSVGTGAGLIGGPITSSGTMSIALAGVTNTMLANPALTVSAGTALTGGGPVALGGSTTLNLDTSKVPELGTANTFTGNQSVTGNLTATGKVGVGTTTPTAQVDVFSSTAGAHTPMARFGSNGTGDSNSFLTYNGTGATEIFQSGFANAFVTGTQAGDGGLRVNPGKNIFFGDSAGGQRMILTSTNALVGSPVPIAIGGTACGNPGEFGGVGFGARSLADCSHYALLGDASNTYLNRPAGGQLLFGENNATQMVLATGGNVGIGTTAPSYLLHVNGMARAEGGLSLGGNAPVSVDAPGTAGGRLAVLANGNVGIGTPAPTSLLHVNGPVRAEGGLSLGGNATLSVDAPGRPGGQFLVANGTVSVNGDTPMSSNPRMSFSGVFIGSLCQGGFNCGGGSGWSGGGFVSDKNILITRVIITLNDPIDPSCGPGFVLLEFLSPLPNVEVSLPTNTTFIDSGPMSVSVPAGTAIALLGEPNGFQSCNVGTSAGGNAFINVQYVMQ